MLGGREREIVSKVRNGDGAGRSEKGGSKEEETATGDRAARTGIQASLCDPRQTHDVQESSEKMTHVHLALRAGGQKARAAVA